MAGIYFVVLEAAMKCEWNFVDYKDGVLTCDMGVRCHDFFYNPYDETIVEFIKHYGDHDLECVGSIDIVPSGKGKFHDLITTAQQFYREYE